MKRVAGIWMLTVSIGTAVLCPQGLTSAAPSVSPAQSASPDGRDDDRPIPGRFTLVNWNAQKGGDAAFDDDLARLVEEHDPDLVFLQEATEDVVPDRPLRPVFAQGWRYPWRAGHAVGVLTAAKVESVQVTRLKSDRREFGITVPKATLASRYALADGQTLLAVNIHCLNFERWGTARLANQLREVRSVMAQHEGPILFAGDFNSWNENRYALVLRVADELGLSEVDGFSAGRKTGDQGPGFVNALLGIDEDLPLDRVFYRGLVPEVCDVLEYDSSDHRALLVTFRLPGLDPAVP